MTEPTTNYITKRSTLALSITGWLLGFLSLIPFAWIFSTWFILPGVSLAFRFGFTAGCIALIISLIALARKLLKIRDRRVRQNNLATVGDTDNV